MTSTQPQGTTGRQSALYTPEAVKVDLPLADVGSRTLAILVDLFVMFSLLYIVLLLAVAALGVASSGFDGGPGWVVIVVILLLNFLVLWGYPAGCETLLNGRTAGKAALGLRVVTTDGAPVRFRHAAIRGLFAFIDFYLFLGIPALVTALLTRRGQRLGDLAAGTVTIRDRATGSSTDQAVFWQVPRELQAYASSLDVRGLNAADYAVVRRFLLRAGSLLPSHRARLAADLGNAMAARMNHRPPAGLHPEALLLCTAALLQGQDDRTPAAQGVRSPRPGGGSYPTQPPASGWAQPPTSGGWTPAPGSWAQPPAPGSWAPPTSPPPPSPSEPPTRPDSPPSSGPFAPPT